MSEARPEYRTQAEGLKQATNHAMIAVTRTELEVLERRLMASLIAVRAALGKSPTLDTREARRGR